MASVVSANDWLSSKGFKTYSFHNDRVQYVALPAAPPAHVMNDGHFFSIDNELVYWNFYLDFGPLNLGQLYRFCSKLNGFLSDPKLKNKTIYFYSKTHPHNRTNAATLICMWAMIYLNMSADEAYKPFRNVSPKFAYFHDATPITCTYNLSVFDCLRGLEKAIYFKFFDFNTFNVEEYEHFEQVENGDLNWHQEGKWLAHAGPHERSELTSDGYRTLTVDDYGPYFQKKGITLVVRLNKKVYDERKFEKYGIRVLDLYYLDGSNPTQKILHKFLEEAEANPGGIAVHCKAGLGRTGTLIGAYMMKHYKFSAAEVIGWLRLCRPGTIIGPQQQYMEEIQQQMWDEGDLFRRQLEDGSHISHSLGSLALNGGGGEGGGEPKRTRRQLTANESKVAEEGDLGQGERLRAMRSKHASGLKVKEDNTWRRDNEDARLSRK